MAERRKTKSKRKTEDDENPTKEEYAVAKHLRFNLPKKEAKLVGMTVQYFVASKAVDMLMDSKWATGSKGTEVLFTDRKSIVNYLDILLAKGLFHRAAKVDKKKDKDKKRKKIKGSDKEEDIEEKKKDKKSKKKEKTEDKESEREDKVDTEKEDEKKEEKKKKEKKYKLTMHDQQTFLDGDEIYVWIYDPVPPKTFIIGLLLVLGAIAVCLFPLWPPEVRLGVYYLSLAAAGFVGVILGLCVVRFILFCLIWICTFGRHHFWMLPNLTEDVGFFESFVPLYKYEYKGGDSERNSKKSDKKLEKENKATENKPEEKDIKDDSAKAEDEKDGSGSEKSGSDNSNGNGYEIIDEDDIVDDTEMNKESAVKA